MKASLRFVALCLLVSIHPVAGAAPSREATADMIVHNARVTTLDERQPNAQAVAIRDGRFTGVGSDEDMLRFKSATTRVIDAGGRRLIPGLNDSHSHYLRGGPSFNLELRWDGVDSLAKALALVREQARRTPKGQWVRVVGGFTPWQFAERRLPTPAELTEASPDRPVFVQYFYSVIVLNRAGLDALKIGADFVAPDGATLERDGAGKPTGNIYASPRPDLFYQLLAMLPKPSAEEARNGTLQLFHTLARYGLTSVIDAGGGGFAYPEDYGASTALVDQGRLPLRVSFYLFAQHPGKELEDYANWMKSNRIGQNRDEHRDHGFELEGAGEWVLAKAGDFENFRSDRPTQAASMETDLKPVILLFVKKRWPFRIHATYDESIVRILDVIETVNAEVPLDGLRWAIDHAETVQPATLDRIKALGGGIALQDRMYFLGDDFVERYGEAAGARTPPLRALLDRGLPVGMGTDATRSSFNPWLGLHFLVSGRVASGRQVLAPENRLSREEALRLYTVGSAWFSQEEQEKGRIAPGQLADFALLTDDYMSVPAERIPAIASALTVVGGRPVHGRDRFATLVTRRAPAVRPSWSPVAYLPAFHAPGN